MICTLGSARCNSATPRSVTATPCSLSVRRSGSFHSCPVWKYYPTGWDQISGNDVSTMAVDNTGSLYILSFVNHGVWEYTDSGWVEIATNISSLSTSPSGSLVYS